MTELGPAEDPLHWFVLCLAYLSLPFPEANWGGNVTYAATLHRKALSLRETSASTPSKPPADTPTK